MTYLKLQGMYLITLVFVSIVQLDFGFSSIQLGAKGSKDIEQLQRATRTAQNPQLDRLELNPPNCPQVPMEMFGSECKNIVCTYSINLQYVVENIQRQK